MPPNDNYGRDLEPNSLEAFARRLVRDDMAKQSPKDRQYSVERAARIIAQETQRGQKQPSWLARNADLWGLPPRRAPKVRL